MNRTQHGSVFPNSILFLLYGCNIFSNHYILWFVCLTSSRVIYPLESVVSCREPLWEIPPMTRSWGKNLTSKAVQDIRDPPGWPQPLLWGCRGWQAAWTWVSVSFFLSLSHSLTPFILRVPLDPAGAGPRQFPSFNLSLLALLSFFLVGPQFFAHI